MKKNILFISSWFPNRLEPTNGNFVQRHAEAVATIHSVEVLHAIGDPSLEQMYLVDDKMIKGVRTLIVYYKKTNNPALNFYKRMKAYKKGFSQVQQPDLVHANVLFNSMFFAVYLKKKFNIPFVITEHWRGFRKQNASTTSLISKKTAQIIGRYASYILPVSDDLRKGIQSNNIGRNYKVVPNVVDLRLFSPKKEENDEFTFVHVSNLIPRKNPDKILNAALRLLEKGYNIRLKIGGDGDITPLQEIIKNHPHKDKIELFGILTTEQVAEKLKNSDAFILLSNDENQPCVIAESFASGLPVISTAVGGIPEFFPKNAGILLDEPNTDDLEKAMIDLVENRSQFASPQELNDYAEKTFSIEAIARQFDTIYNKVLS